MKFLRNLLAAILGFFIAIFLLFIFFAAIGAVVGNPDKDVTINNKSVLEIDLSTPIKDYAPKSTDPLEEILNMGDEKLALNKIINAIENAKTDDRIKGISLKSMYVNAGIAQTQAIRKKLDEFKSSGKFIYAYADLYTQKSYYLNSVADSLFINPVGSVEFKGLTSEILYYKDFEDKYGIKMEVIRHGKYKSAVEPYLANKMSEANREQTTSFLKSIWSEIVTEISNSRKISSEKLNLIADNALGNEVNSALENNLVDAIIYEDQYEDKLKNLTASKKVNSVSINNYIKSGKGRISSKAKNKIAVIYAQGEIRYAKGNEKIIGQELMKKAIRKATKDKKVKAIVLRVNSPGGSALASDLIWRELELAKKEKPLVVSMGNLAASGGYYIACGADKIIAEPTTITGSIGVYGAIPNAYGLSQKMGINAEQVHTNNNGYYSVFEPMDKKFYNVTKKGVENIYKVFVNRVAKGRKMTFEQVNEVAQGRVWTGKQAIEKGLVDQLGGLDDAIAAAAEIAEVDNYRIRNYPNYKKDFKDALKMNPFTSLSKETLIREALGEENFRLYNNINQIRKAKGIQAKMPFILEVK